VYNLEGSSSSASAKRERQEKLRAALEEGRKRAGERAEGGEGGRGLGEGQEGGAEDAGGRGG